MPRHLIPHGASATPPIPPRDPSALANDTTASTFSVASQTAYVCSCRDVPGAVLNETVVTVSLSTAPGPSVVRWRRAVRHYRVVDSGFKCVAFTYQQRQRLCVAMRRWGSEQNRSTVYPQQQTSQLRLRKKIKYRMYARTSRSAYKSTPVYRLVSDVADAINSVPRDAAMRKVHVFCDKINSWSLIIARCHAVPCARVQHRHLQCQSCASHAHVGDLPAITQHRTHYTSSRPFISLQYQVTQTNVTYIR